MSTIPAFPTTWRCGFPHDFVAKFQVDEWVKRGLPYMNEKGWADYLMMIADLVTPEEQQAKAALVEAARALYEVWEKMQEETEKGAGGQGDV